MTRLEQAGEPSMEDILASIRKIIAEDPPGSRALPEVRAELAAPSVTNRIFQRMGEAVRSEQAKPAATPAVAPAAISEPYLRSSMPSLSSQPSGAPAADAGKPFDTTAKPFDIDAQMAEVLSKTRGGAPRRDVEPSFGPTLPEVQAALDSLSLASNVPAAPAPFSRPGFTVARDGFVPDAQMNAQMNVPSKSPLNDPFEFALGPSPFAARSGPQQSLATTMPEVRDTRFQDFGTLVPSRPFAAQSEAAETPVAAKADAPDIEELNVDQRNVDQPNVDQQDVMSAIAADVGEVPSTSEVESTDTNPAETVASSTPSPEAVAAQLKDFETAIRPPSDVTLADATPTATLVSVDTVLAELKSKLDRAAAQDTEATEATASVDEPEPAHVAAPADAELPDPESVPLPQVMSAPGPESVAFAAYTPAASTTEGVGTDMMAARIIETPAADIVDIEEPAPIAAPAMMQEMVIAEPHSEDLRASSMSHSPSPFHAMQSSGMQSIALPGSRSMEDTVAELLRPMLRNWLAENMPKIVERALRKEIDDSLHSEHKTAAE